MALIIKPKKVYAFILNTTYVCIIFLPLLAFKWKIIKNQNFFICSKSQRSERLNIAEIWKYMENVGHVEKNKG